MNHGGTESTERGNLGGVDRVENVDKSRYTPGPWRVVPPDKERPSRAIVGAYEGYVEIYNAPLTMETAANARLIAEAPAMVDVLESLLELEDAMLPACREPAEDCGCTFCSARLILARVRG